MNTTQPLGFSMALRWGTMALNQVVIFGIAYDPRNDGLD